jgi:glycolate oxidase
MSNFQRLCPQDVDAFRQFMPGHRVLLGDAIVEDYCHDEMTEYGSYPPDAVLLAESADEIAKVLAYCNARNIAVTPRGSGTGLCGGCVAKLGGVVLSTERMNHILEIDAKNMTVTVEPGVLMMELIKALEGTGLFYPPDPGEKSATLGGNVMTNAGGMRALRYGVTRDYVLGMQVVTASGTVLELGGKTVKNSSGYSLMHLMIGSEGTLAFLSRITLKLIGEPRVNLSILAPFDDLDRCVEAMPHVLLSGCEPTAIEFMERDVITAAEEYLGKQFPDTDSNAYLLLRLDGSSAQALEPSLDTLTELLLRLGARDVLLADTDERKTTIWDARGTFLEAIKSGTPSMDECDVVVPRDRIAIFMRKSIEIAKAWKIRIRSFGHAGDGNLHLYICKDALTDDAWETKRLAVMEALYTEARSLGGQVSGEHGIGHAKSGYLCDAIGAESIALMRGIKAVFDPNGILNPGKVVG